MTEDTSNGIIKNETGAQTLLGYVLDVGHEDRKARCLIEITDEHLNRHASLHGGISSAVLDNAMGATASLTVDKTGRRPFLTISLNTHYLAPAKKGDVLTAIGRVVGGGMSTKFLEGELRDQNGKLIATATGVFKRVPEKRLAPESTAE
ncbi:MAG: PaaI family thioesterase [Granulosicoccus sp.]